MRRKSSAELVKSPSSLAEDGDAGTVWTGFRQTYRRRAKGDKLPSSSSSGPSSSYSSGEEDMVATKGRKRKRPASPLCGGSQEVGPPSEFSPEDILTALKDAAEMKYEERIDWEDVPGCWNYTLTKKDYNKVREVLMTHGTRKNPAIPPEERKGPMIMPTEEEIIDAMGVWSMGLKQLGLKRHGLGVQK